MWAATSIMLQLGSGEADPMKTKILLMTAERLLTKVAPELQNQGQASELYLNILERQEKYQEGINVLTKGDSVFATAAAAAAAAAAATATAAGDAATPTPSLLVSVKCSTTLPAAKLKQVGAYFEQLKEVENAVAAYKEVLNVHNPDDWEAYVRLVALCGGGDDDEYASAHAYMEELEVLHPLLRGPALGKLFLSFERRKKEGKEGKEGKQGPKNLLVDLIHYVEKFGSKACCYGDLCPILDGLPQECLPQFVTFLQEEVATHDPRAVVVVEKEEEEKEETATLQARLKIRLNGVRRCVVGHQMLRRLGFSVSGSEGGVSAAMEEWLSLYESTHAVHAMVLEEEKRKEEEAEKALASNGKEAGKGASSESNESSSESSESSSESNSESSRSSEVVVETHMQGGAGSGGSSGKLQREFHCGDDLILLAVHALLEHDDDQSTGGPFLRSSFAHLNVGMNWSDYRQKCFIACCLLEYGLSKSSDNYHLKLLKLRVYGYLGGCRVALDMYEQLGPKHIQLETLAWWIMDTIEDYAQFKEMTTLVDRIVEMHTRNQEKLPDMMSLAFRHDNVGQVRRFFSFVHNTFFYYLNIFYSIV